MCSRYSDSLRTQRSGDRIPVETRFSALVQTDPGGPTSLLYNEYRVFHGSKAVGTWRWPPIPSSSEVRERIELYLYPLRAFVACSRVNFTLPLTFFLLSDPSLCTNGLNLVKMSSFDILIHHSLPCNHSTLYDEFREHRQINRTK